MRRIWLIALLALTIVWGCSRGESPPQSLLSSQKAIPAGPVDSFGLPLVIVIKPPEVPKEIAEPSPPIHQEANNAGGDKK